MRRLGHHSLLTRAGGQASPPKLRRRTRGGRWHSSSSEVMMLMSVGTALTSVMPRSAHTPVEPPRPGTSWHSERLPTARCAPPAMLTHLQNERSAPSQPCNNHLTTHTSSINMSKAALKPCQTISVWPVLRTDRSLRQNLRAALWGISIPGIDLATWTAC
jgi:hypothetical protein